MIFGKRCTRNDIKPPSGLEQFTALHQLLEIDSRNPNGLQVARAQHSQLAREFQHFVLVGFGHEAIITQCMQIATTEYIV